MKVLRYGSVVIFPDPCITISKLRKFQPNANIKTSIIDKRLSNFDSSPCWSIDEGYPDTASL